MSQVQVDNIYNLNADGPPTFPMGATVTGVTTSGSFSGDLTGNVTGNVSGDLNVGTSLTITASGVNVPAGIVTAASLSATNVSAGGTNVMTAITAKASTGKAIAMSMVFG